MSCTSLEFLSPFLLSANCRAANPAEAVSVDIVPSTRDDHLPSDAPYNGTVKTHSVGVSSTLPRAWALPAISPNLIYLPLACSTCN